MDSPRSKATATIRDLERLSYSCARRSPHTSQQFSSDGRWLAYHSNETGTYEVYVGPFPGSGGRQQYGNVTLLAFYGDRFEDPENDGNALGSREQAKFRLSSMSAPIIRFRSRTLDRFF
jgi:hypothetical protein